MSLHFIFSCLEMINAANRKTVMRIVSISRFSVFLRMLTFNLLYFQTHVTKIQSTVPGTRDIIAYLLSNISKNDMQFGFKNDLQLAFKNDMQLESFIFCCPHMTHVKFLKRLFIFSIKITSYLYKRSLLF